MVQVATDFIKTTTLFTTELFPFLSVLIREPIRFAKGVQENIVRVFGPYVEEIRKARKEGKEIPCACNEFMKEQETNNEEGHIFDLARKLMTMIGERFKNLVSNLFFVKS